MNDDENFKQWLDSHTHSTGVGPSGPPTPQLMHHTITAASTGTVTLPHTVSNAGHVWVNSGSTGGHAITQNMPDSDLNVNGTLKINGEDYQDRIDFTELTQKFLIELQLRAKKFHKDLMRKYVGMDGMIIKFIPAAFQTQELQMIAVVDDPWSIEFIKNPCRKVQGQAIVGDPEVKDVIENLDPTLELFEI